MKVSKFSEHTAIPVYISAQIAFAHPGSCQQELTVYCDKKKKITKLQIFPNSKER